LIKPISEYNKHYKQCRFC